jgi:hypothetical protein
MSGVKALFGVLAALASAPFIAGVACAQDAHAIAIVIHGGAGVINKAEMSPEREARAIGRGSKRRATPATPFSSAAARRWMR